jgi:hypothetical protein
VEAGILIDLAGWFAKFLYKATVVVVAVAVVATVVLAVAERTQIKRHIVADILPMWSMLMAYFLTMKGRLAEIERTSTAALQRLGMLEQATPAGAPASERWRESASGSMRHELKRALRESELGAAELRSVLAPVASALLKLESDTELFRAYSRHLSERMESLWSEKLQLVHAGGGGLESVHEVATEARAVHFYISRHLGILRRYLRRYVEGDRDEVTCENVANYWPYFLGQPDRLLVTAREDFLQGYLGEHQRRALTLAGRIELIEESLAEVREEIGRKTRKALPQIDADTIWGR